MVVKMMRWRPWPPMVTKRYEVKLVVLRLEGWDRVREGVAAEKDGKLTVEIRWKGPKGALSTLRRTPVKRNFTREVAVARVNDDAIVGDDNGVIFWDEEFHSLCTFSSYKENMFHPWEIYFTVFNGLNDGPKGKVPVVGSALLNLAEFASAAEQKEFELNLPLSLAAGAAEDRASLCISLSLLELRAAQEITEPVQRAIVPVSSSSQSGESSSTDKDELSAIKAGLKKVKIFTEFVSIRRAKKACREEEGSSDSRSSSRSEDGEYNYPFDSDSLEDFEEGESGEDREESSVRKSFSYGSLVHANNAGGSLYSSTRITAVDEDWVYYSHRNFDVGASRGEDSAALVSESTLLQSSKRSILLSWRKRKLSFRSPKAKGEPLLKKGGEEGGDDIDYDRRQLSSDESLSLWRHKSDEHFSANQSSISDFGDDHFSVGSWENKEVICRDGQMKLESQVFFASIDQRNERAAGESACTALVAVIADWFQNNHGLLPIKSQFDSLIREGSLEWRNLCEIETYRERFPDKHFDLDTVLQAKIRPLGVVPGKSFIGFFHPEGMDEGRFDFLHGAMSFDNIWDEISHSSSDISSNDEPHLYIVSWNDHFFVLKVEPEAYYIIDTLGERLYEGCNQAYILTFDNSTVIHKLPKAAPSTDEKPTNDQQVATEPKKQEGSVTGELPNGPEEPMKSGEVEEVVCRGKESCKEYIKSFLAAIPIRELQADIKKGLIASTPLHHQLQIEFHYTKFFHPEPEEALAAEVTTTATPPHALEVPITVAAT